MQTFLPYANFRKSLACLDYKRLGKQRVEAMQIYNQITKGKGGYPHHPVNKMWQEYPNALVYYHNLCLDEWVARGYKNTMSYISYDQSNNGMFPHWLNNRELHSSHRSNLLRKDYAFYSQYGWEEPTDLPYVWLKEKEL